MTLPLILVPSGTPPFRSADHKTKLDEFYSSVKFTAGRSRQRRLYTGTEPRTVSIAWDLSSEQMQIIDEWAEYTLKAYTEHFSVQVASNQAAGLLWWEANWIEPYKAEPLDSGRWAVTGTLYLTGEGSVTGPDTGAFTIEFSVPVTGSASTTLQKAFGVEFLSHVLGKTRLRLEIFVPVDEGPFSPGAGSVVLTGYAPSLLFNYIYVPNNGVISLTGRAPVENLTFSMETGALTISGLAPFTSIISPLVGSVALSGYAPTKIVDTPRAPGAGRITISSYAGTGVLAFGLSASDRTTVVYDFGSDTLVSGTDMPTGRGRDGSSATGTTSKGYFGNGYNGSELNWIEIYTYIGNTSVSGTNLGFTSRYSGAAGNATRGIWAGSVSDNGVTSKYTYSGDTVAAGGNLTYQARLSGAAGNTTVGVWGSHYGSGSGSAQTSKYTYGTDISAAGTSLGTSRYGAHATSTANVGYFGGGFNGSAPLLTVLDKYTFSSDTVSSGTSLGVARQGVHALGNTSMGLFAGGAEDGVASTYTDKYTYATDTVLAGTALSVARGYGGTASDAHGGL